MWTRENEKGEGMEQDSGKKQEIKTSMNIGRWKKRPREGKKSEKNEGGTKTRMTQKKKITKHDDNEKKVNTQMKLSAPSFPNKGIIGSAWGLSSSSRLSVFWSGLRLCSRQELLDVRHSVFIVGNAGTGKTCVWKTLFKTYQVR